MKKTNNITDDALAFYIGTAFMCIKCEINLEKIEVLEQRLDFVSFYEIDASFALDLINKHKIKKTPFYIISKNGVLVDLFYEYSNLMDIASRLLVYKESVK